MFDPLVAKRFLAGCLLAILAACAGPPRPAPMATSPTDHAGPRPRPANVYRVVASDVTVRVYRDGPLAQLGHNHVIASNGMSGQVELREPLAASAFSLALPLDSLTVDEADRRAAAGEEFPDNLTEADKEGTRRNLLGPALLDAARFPILRLISLGVDESSGGLHATARVDVLGIDREIRVPVALRVQDPELIAEGEFVLTHAELGLTPFSAALGALRVRDDMHVAYRLVARRDGQ